MCTSPRRHMILGNWKQNLLCVMVFVVLLAAQILVIVFVYSDQQDKETDNAKIVIAQLEQNFKTQLTESFKIINYFVEYGENFANQNIQTISLAEFVARLKIEILDIANVLNEYKVVPIVKHENRTSYEFFGKQGIKQNFSIVDAVFQNNIPSFVPSPNRTYYCPLSLLAPNVTPALFDFIGVDLCNTTTWKPFFEAIDALDDTPIIVPRFVIRTQTTIIDIGKKIVKGNVTVGYSVNSFFIKDFFDRSITRIYNTNPSNIGLLIVQDEIQEPLISQHQQIDSSLTSTFLFNTFANKNWTITLRYSDNFVDDFKDKSADTILYLLIVIFLAFNLFVLLIKSFWKRNKYKNKQKLANVRASIASNMISYVNHEVRNPLNSVMGLLQLAKVNLMENSNKTYDTEPLVSNIDTAYKSCLMIKHVVNDVLDIQRLENNKLSLEYTSINMEEFYSNFSKLIRPKIEENSYLEFGIDNTIGTLECDYYRLQQILLNLAGNAFKFTDDGFVNIRSSIRNETAARFEVHDSGRGISEEKKPFLFQPFSQVKTNDATKFEGFGLGLYLCKMLVDNLCGTIGFDSIEGKGTVFWFELPLKRECTEITIV